VETAHLHSPGEITGRGASCHSSPRTATSIWICCLRSALPTLLLETAPGNPRIITDLRRWAGQLHAALEQPGGGEAFLPIAPRARAECLHLNDHECGRVRRVHRRAGDQP
jgi:hypothetical protein